jgi:hypothetical protein
MKKLLPKTNVIVEIRSKFIHIVYVDFSIYITNMGGGNTLRFSEYNTLLVAKLKQPRGRTIATNIMTMMETLRNF